MKEGYSVRYVLKIYKTKSGICPFDNWINGLRDKKAQVAVDVRLERVRMGNLGQYRSLGGMLYELKIDFGPGYRVYFGKIGTDIILLLCAGNKGTQQKDIERARKYFQDFKDAGKKV